MGHAVEAKNVGHAGHIRWLGPNVWWEISQIYIEYVKAIRQMSDEPWKFFAYTGHVALGLLSGALSNSSSLCNSFDDQAAIDFIYVWLIFKWVAVIQLKGGTPA